MDNHEEQIKRLRERIAECVDNGCQAGWEDAQDLRKELAELQDQEIGPDGQTAEDMVEDKYDEETKEFPNIEIFAVSQMEVNYNLQNMDHATEFTITEAGWYWWSCSPGCLPDSPASGPFKTEKEAYEDAHTF